MLESTTNNSSAYSLRWLEKGVLKHHDTDLGVIGYVCLYVHFFTENLPWLKNCGAQTILKCNPPEPRSISWSCVHLYTSSPIISLLTTYDFYFFYGSTLHHPPGWRRKCLFVFFILCCILLSVDSDIVSLSCKQRPSHWQTVSLFLQKNIPQPTVDSYGFKILWKPCVLSSTVSTHHWLKTNLKKKYLKNKIKATMSH